MTTKIYLVVAASAIGMAGWLGLDFVLLRLILVKGAQGIGIGSAGISY